MLSEHTVAIERLVQAAARFSIPLPAELGSVGREQILIEAVERNRPLPEGTTYEELLTALDQVARSGGFDALRGAYLEGMLKPRTPLSVLRSLGQDRSRGLERRDLALALARAYRDFGPAPTLRHELFQDLVPHMDVLDALDVVADSDMSNRPLRSQLEGFLTAEDAALIMEHIPADTGFSLRYGPVFSPEDTLAMLRFGGYAGAVLALRAGALTNELFPLLVKGRTARELLELLSSMPIPVISEAVSALDENELTALLIDSPPSLHLANALVHRVKLSEEALLSLLRKNPSLVMNWVRYRESPNPFSPSLLRRWAAQMDASRVRVTDFPESIEQDLALALKGAAPKIQALLADSSDPAELRALLKAAHGVFGNKPRLWSRLATASPSSPFGDRELSLVEATSRYLERWNAAAARKTKKV